MNEEIKENILLAPSNYNKYDCKINKTVIDWERSLYKIKTFTYLQNSCDNSTIVTESYKYSEGMVILTVSFFIICFFIIGYIIETLSYNKR